MTPALRLAACAAERESLLVALHGHPLRSASIRASGSCWAIRDPIAIITTLSCTACAARFCCSAIREYGAHRGCVPHCNRHRAAAEGAEFRAARGALAGEALSLHGPTRRHPCRARICAQGLFAHPGISRDRRSANASQRADVVSQSKDRRPSIRRRLEVSRAIPNARSGKSHAHNAHVSRSCHHGTEKSYELVRIPQRP
jgi:hypothetical protein